MFALIDFWSLFVQCVCFLIYFSVSYDFETNLKSFYFHICLFIPFICTLTHSRKKSLLMLSVLNILAPEQKHKHRHLTFYRHGLPLTIMLIEHMIYSSAFHPKQIFFLCRFIFVAFNTISRKQTWSAKSQHVLSNTKMYHSIHWGKKLP